jgi:16S rRNA processing protein RimM
MIQEATTAIGQLIKTSGNHGELILQLSQIESENITHWESIFLLIEGGLVPFFISDIRPKAQHSAFIQLQDVNTPESAEKLVGAPCYVASVLVEENEELTAQLIGYAIFNGETYIGQVVAIEAMPQNPLLIVESDEGDEFTLPIHENLIILLDEEKKHLHLDLPEGLLDL